MKYKTNIPYKIGGKYMYPNSKDVFVLKKVCGFIFHFECGKWCTDSVFVDLIDLSINKQIFEILPPKQLKLNL